MPLRFIKQGWDILKDVMSFLRVFIMDKYGAWITAIVVSVGAFLYGINRGEEGSIEHVQSLNSAISEYRRSSKFDSIRRASAEMVANSFQRKYDSCRSSKDVSWLLQEVEKRNRELDALNDFYNREIDKRSKTVQSTNNQNKRMNSEINNIINQNR